MQLTGSQVIIECLKEQGVDTVFGYPGGAILNVYDELYKHPEIKHVLTSHEQGASHAADGYARSTGKVGVCMVGISRSSFYKYKDDIFPYHENQKGKTITMVIQLDDEPGLLSIVLKTIADFHANILTIHQSIPVNGIASLSLSIDVFPTTGNVEDMKNSIESVQGIHYAKILARE